MNIDLQPLLENDLIRIRPLVADDFEALFAVASDPLLWAQHPNKNRYERPVFETFFKGAIESGGAFIIYDKQTGKPIGSSRYYDIEEEKKSVAIGYTFFARDHWGTTFNRAVKTLMLDHAFQYVDTVIFHVGAKNLRSQKAIERLGALKIAELEMEYYGEPERLNFVYEMTRERWSTLKSSRSNPNSEGF